MIKLIILTLTMLRAYDLVQEPTELEDFVEMHSKIHDS